MNLGVTEPTRGDSGAPMVAGKTALNPSRHRDTPSGLVVSGSRFLTAVQARERAGSRPRTPSPAATRARLCTRLGSLEAYSADLDSRVVHEHRYVAQFQ